MKHINELRAEWAAAEAEIDELTAKEELTEEERTKLTDLDTEAEGLASQIKEVEAREERKARFMSLPADEPAAKPEEVRVTKEPLTYEQHAPYSYFKDMARMAARGDMAAKERIERHQTEVEVETRAMSRTDTTSVGEFVPPLWLVDMYGPALRAGRTAANLVGNFELPGNTDSINIPTLNGGTTALTAAGIQQADNSVTGIGNTDMISNTVTAHVNTVAGFNDVALQVLEQSALAGGFDALIFKDLTADLNKQLDIQVISGSGGSGQSTGILGTTGVTNITSTQATPTIITQYPVFSQAISKVSKARFEPPTAFLMRPDRWYWLLSAVDTAGRPVVVPNMNGPFQSAANVGEPVAEGGPAGWLQSIPVYLDANLPNTTGAGSLEDRWICGRFSDALLWEGPLRTSVHPDILASQLTVRLRIYKYFAFTAARIPVSFAFSSGTGNNAVTTLAAF